MLSSLFGPFIILLFITFSCESTSLAHHHQHFDRFKRSSSQDHDGRSRHLETPDENNGSAAGTSSRDFRSGRSSSQTTTRISSSASSPNDMVVVMMINDNDNLIKQTTTTTTTNSNMRRSFQSSIEDDDMKRNNNHQPRTRTSSVDEMASSFLTFPSSLTAPSSLSRHDISTRARNPLEDDDFIRRSSHDNHDDDSSSLDRLRDFPSTSTSRKSSPGNFLQRQRQSFIPTPPPFQSNPMMMTRIRHFDRSLSSSRFEVSSERMRHPDGPDDDRERSVVGIDRDRLPELIRNDRLPMAPWERRRKEPKKSNVGNWIAKLMKPVVAQLSL